MTNPLYGTPAPIDHEDHARFTALVKTLLAYAKHYKPKSYLHMGLPLVHYAERHGCGRACNATMARAHIPNTAQTRCKAPYQ